MYQSKQILSAILLLIAFTLTNLVYSQKTFTDSTSITCSYANGVATIYPAPIQIPANVRLNATGNLRVKFKYTGDLFYSYENLTFYGENNFYIGFGNLSVSCGASFVNQNFNLLPNSYSGWIQDGMLVFGIQSSSSVNNNCNFQSFTNTNFCAQIVVELDYFEYPNDAGVSEFIFPTGSTGAGTQPIVVQGMNLGTNPLTSVNVGWSVNGTSQISKSISFSSPLVTGGTFTDTIGNFNFHSSNTYQLKAWTQNPNNQFDSLAANDTAVATTCIGYSGTYSVGNSSATFKNLNDAYNNLKSCGITGPVVLNLLDSTNERLQISTDSIPGYSATNNLTIHGNGNGIYYFGNFTNPEIIHLKGADFVTIDSVNFISLSSTYGWGIWLSEGANFNTIKNCTFDLTNTTTTSINRACGIVASSLNNTLSGGDANKNIFHRNTFIRGNRGIALLANSQYSIGARGNKITNNIFKDVYESSIYTVRTDSTEIIGNEGTGEYLHYRNHFFVYSNSDYRLNVRNNYLHDFNFPPSNYYLYAFYFADSDGGLNNESYVVNNIVEDGTGERGIYGIYNYRSNYIHFYHNTIRGASIESNITSYGIYDYQGYDSKYYNNIIEFNYPNSTNASTGIYLSTTSSNILDDNNIVYFHSKTSNNYFGYYGGYRSSESEWENLTFRGDNNLEINPLFLSDSSHTPKSVTANNAGKTGLGISLDFFGISRSTTPDIGAIEFTPPLNDLALTNIILPDSGCGLNSAILKIEVGNFGINAYSSFSGSFQVGSGKVYTQTFSVSLPSGATNTLVFDSLASFPIEGNTYNVTAWINALNDADITNDTIKGKQIKNIAPSPISTTDSLIEDFSGNNTYISGIFNNGWRAYPEQNYYWTIENYYTQAGSGPLYDNTTGNSSGRFAFVRTTSYASGQQAFIESPCIKLIDTINNSMPVLSFWYHKYGAEMGDLVVQLKDANFNWITLDSIVGQTQSSNSAPFIKHEIDLANFIGLSTSIRFKAISLFGDDGDMAIDDIKLIFKPVTCDSISQINFNNINDTSVSFSWSSNIGAQKTEIQWGNLGFSLGSGTTDSTQANQFRIGGLNNLKNYQIYIRQQCSNGSYTPWSGPFNVFTNNYCTSNLHSNDCSTYSSIGSVQIEQIQNLNSGCNSNANGHSLYSQQIALLSQEESYDLTITPGSSQRTYFTAWIDFNRDGSFNTFNEFIGGAGYFYSTPHTFIINVPQGTDTGLTILRIRSDYYTTINTWSESCLSGTYGETEDYLVRLLPPPTCPKPKDLAAGYETTTSTRLSWNARGVGSSWEIEYGTANFTKGTGTVVQSTDSFAIISGLNAYSNYTYYVRTICAPGDTSNWSNPFTFNTYPYCYNGLLSLGCSQSTPYDIGSVQFNTINNTTNNCPPGSFSSFANISTSVTPSISYPIQVQTNNQATLNMAVWIDFNNDGDFLDANEFVLAGTSNTQTPLSGLVTIPLNAVQGNTIMRVRSSNSSLNSSSSCANFTYGEIEDYTINILPAPSCPAPNYLGVNNITSSSANLYWTSIGNGSKWLIEFDTVGFTLGNGIMDSSTTNYKALLGLNLFGTYDAYVKEVCSQSDTSGWTGPVTFNVNPYCTTNLHYSYSNCGYQIDTVSLGSFSYADQNEPCPINSYHQMFATPIVLNKLESYSLRVKGKTTDLLSTGVWIDWNGDGSFNSSDEFLGFASRSYGNIFTSNINIPLQANSGKVIMRVRTYNGTSIGSSWGCSNFGYGETMDFLIDIQDPLGCVTPYNLTSSFHSFTSANISWTDYSNAGIFEIEYDTTGFVFGTGNRIFSTDTIETIQNLAQNGYYDFYVRAICGSADTSAWSTSHTFTTFPYCFGDVTNLHSTTYSCYQKLTNFQIDSFIRDYSSAPCGANSYSFEPTTINIEAGSNVPLKLNGSSTFTSTSPAIGVWIDYNQDGDFDDNGEFVASTSRYDSKPYNTNILIPTTANIGTTIMRVRTLTYTYIYAYDACDTYTFGETKDFVVNILPPPSCPKPYNLTLYGTPSNTAARIGFLSLGNGNAWEIKYDSVGFNPSISGTSVIWTTTVDSLRGLTPFNNYEVYVREICAAGDTSNWSSSPLTFTTNPYCFPTYVNDCSVNNYYINAITLNSSIIGQTGCSGNANNYSFFDLRNSAFNFEAGTSQNFLITTALGYYGYVWIDWNKNGQFESSEGTNLGYGTAPKNFTMNIPIDFFGNLMVRFRISRYTLYNYDFCSYESFGETEDYLFFVNPEPCPAIPSVNVNSTTDSSITIGWTQSSIDSNTVFNILVRELGGGLDTVISNVNQNPYTVNHLNAATQYSLAVQNNCNARGDSLSDVRDSTIATTNCAAYNANYSQNFEGSFLNGAPICWEIQDYSLNPSNSGATSLYSNSGSYGFYSYRQQNQSGNFASFLVSPFFSDLQAGDKQLRFYARSSSTINTEIIVGTTKDYIGSNVRFNPIDTIRISNVFQQYFVNLSNLTPGDNRISFRFAMSPYNYIYLDDINYETKPACNTPLNLDVLQVSSNSAIVTWDSVGSNQYLLSYGNATLGASGILNGTLVNKTTNIDTITGLFPNSNYQFAVQQVCQLDSSYWNGPITFSTTCVPDTAPYLENFTSVNNNSLPGCWSQPFEASIPWYTDNFGTSSLTGPYYDGDGIYGGKYVYLESSFGLVSDSGVIITQPIATHQLNNPYLFFDYHAYGSGIGNFKISISDDYGKSWKKIFTLSGQQQTSRFNYFNNYQLNLKDYKNKTITFKITGTKLSTSGDMALDNFEINEAPPCGDPHSLVVTNNLFGNTVDVSWQGSDSSLLFKVNYAQSTFSISGGTVVNNGTSKNISLTGLSPNTTYRVYVKSICANDSSTWIGPLTFTTSCAPQMAPMSQDFGLSYTSPPSCWSTYTSTTENWYFAPSSLSAQAPHSGTSYAYLNDNNTIITPDNTLESPSIIIDTLTNPVLTYWYWSANNSGQLRVQALQNGNWVTLQNLSKSTNREWEEQVIDLSAVDDTTKIRFIGAESPFNTDNYQAIDLIEIKNGKLVDASIESIYANSGNCGTGNFSFNIQFKNNGINNTSATLKLLIDDTISYSANVNINALANSSYTFSNLNLEGGRRNIKAYFEAIPGDQNNTDDSLSVYRFLKGITPINVVNDSTCSTNDTIILLASGADEYLWYENSLGTFLAGNGNSLQVANQTTSKTYYVKGKTKIASKGGSPDITASTLLTSSDKTMGLIFDVYAPIRLDSLTVYPNGMGNVIVTIKNKNGFVVGVKTVPVPNGFYAAQRIPIGINLIADENYRITLEGTSDITWFRSNSNLPNNFYPITDEASTFSITSSTEGDSRYHYFYDWKVSLENCYSNLTPVTAHLIQLTPPTSSGGAIYCQDEAILPLMATGDSSKLFWYESTDITTVIGTGNHYSPANFVGTKTFKVRESQGNCFTSFSDQTITIKPKANAIISKDTSICEGQIVRLYASGGSNFIWSNGSTQNNILVGPTTNTTYSVIANNQNGCKADTAFTHVSVNQLPSLNLSAPANICAGDTARLIASSNWPITWSNALGSADTLKITPNNTSTFMVTATDTFGCSQTNSATIIVNPLPLISGGTYNQVCIGDTIQLFASGGVSYIWNNTDSSNTIEAVITSDTTFSVVGFGNNGCKNSDQVMVNLKSNLNVYAGNDTSITSGNSVNLNPLVSGGSGNYSFKWLPDSLVLNGNVANTSTVSMNKTAILKFEVNDNNNGCSAEDYIAINILGGNVTANPTSSQNNICSGDSLQLFANAGGATGNYTYKWSPGDLVSDSTIANPIAYPVANTVFTVEVKEGSASVIEPISIIVRGLPFSGITNDTATCVGEPITLQASGGANYFWSNGANTDTSSVSPVFPTTYRVTITGNNGCKSIESVFVNTKSLPTINITGLSKVCIGDSVTLTASGATNYLWMSGEQTSTAKFKIQQASTISVTGEQNNGCKSTATFNVGVDSLPNVDAGINQSICLGDTATISAIGALTYNWNNNSTLQSIDVAPNATATYYVIGTDINGCSNMDSVEVIINNLPTVSAGNDTSICKGDAATLVAKGGTQFLWENGNTNPSIQVSPINTQVFWVTVSDANGCESSDSVFVFVNDLPIADAGTNQAICLNDTANLNATGGTQYAWSNGGTSSNIQVSPSISTLLHVTVTDANSCSSTDTVRIVVNELPVADAGTDISICLGDTASLNAFGGMNYQWSNGVNLSSLQVSPSNNQKFTVTVTDSNGCSATDSITIQVNTLPIVNAGKDTTICNNSFTLLQASGAQTYIWNNGINQQNNLISPSNNQVYWVVGTDLNGCKNSDSVTVWVNQLPQVSAGNDTSICVGDTAHLFGFGGSIYSWSTGENNADIQVSPSLSTQFILTATDSNGCTNSDSVFVTLNNLPQVNAGNNISICFGDQTILTASGGASNNDYLWSTSQTLNSITVSPTINTTYTVTATDINGCKNSDSVQVSINQLPTAIAGSDQTICFGDTATLFADGGNAYLWSNNVSTATNSVSPSVTSDFVVTVTNQNGCIDRDTLTIYVNQLPNIQASADTFTCLGQPIQISAIGAQNFIWNTGDTGSTLTVNPATSSTYSVVGTDGNGCSNIDSVVVLVNTLPNVSLSADTTICIGDSITIVASGGSSYQWSNGSNSTQQIIAPAQPTKYVVTVSNASGCISTDSIQVNLNQLPIVSAGADTSICIGETAILNAMGGVLFQWSNGNSSSFNSVSPNNTTTYQVTITDINQCSSIDSVTVNIWSLPQVIAGNNQTICEQTQASLSATGLGDFVWSTGDTNSTIVVNVIDTTVFSVTLTDANGCKNSDTTTIFTLPNPVVNLNNDTSVCYGENVTLVAGGGTSYLWSNGNNGNMNGVSPSQTQFFYVTVSDVNNCVSTDSVLVNVWQLPTANAGVNDTICFGDQTILNATGGLNYLWSNNAQTASTFVSPIQTSNYSVTVTDINGCTDADSVVVFVNLLPNAEAGFDQSICAGDTASLLASGGIQYIWSNNNFGAQNHVSPSQSTKYFVTVTDTFGCQNTDSVLVEINQLPQAFAGNDTSICIGNSITLIASGGLNYLWNNNINVAANTVSPMNTTQYSVTVTNVQGCTSSDSILVFINSLPNGSITPNQNMCLNDSVTLTANGGVHYLWSNGSPSQTIKVSPGFTQNFVVTITNNNGCSIADTTAVNVFPLPSVSQSAFSQLCDNGNPFNLTGGIPSGGIYGGNFVNNNQFLPTASGAGTFAVYYKVTNSFGCSDSIFQNIVINAAPSVTVPSFGEVCINNGSVALSGGTPLGGVYTGNNVTGGAFNPQTAGTGVHIISYNYTDAKGCSSQDTASIIVNPAPSPTLGNDTTVCLNIPFILNPGSFQSYQWSNGATTPTILPTKDGIYTVTVTDINGCTNTDDIQITIETCPSVNDLDGEGFDILYYPNPARQEINLVISGRRLNEVELEIYNLSGSLISKISIQQLQSGVEIPIDISKLTAGVYFVKLNTSNSIRIDKITVY